jgi:hypothetical protein
MKNLMILSTPRSGSSALLQAFDTLDQKIIYEPVPAPKHQRKRGSGWQGLTSGQAGLHAVDVIRNRAGDSEAYVVKHLVQQIDMLENLKLLNTLQWPTIFLHRKNWAYGALSWYLCNHTGKWHKKPSDMPEVDMDKLWVVLNDYLRWSQHLQGLYRIYKGDSIITTYEEILTGAEWRKSFVTNFAEDYGISMDWELSEDFSGKIHPPEMLTKIPNWPDVKKLLDEFQ